MKITIEPVQAGEVQMLADFSSKTFYDTFYKHNSEEDMRLFLAENLTADRLAAEMKQPFNYFYFAKAEGEIAGYLKLSTLRVPEQISETKALEIARIYVSEDKKGFGLGKALINFSLSFAGQKNKPVIWLGVWEHNLHAIGFYKRHGFEKFDEHTFILGKDIQTDWLMKKYLI